MDNKSLESTLTVQDRKNITLSGVKKIDSFSSSEFHMDTTLGYIKIIGNDLEIVKLDTYQGNIAIKGFVNSISYKEAKVKEESLLSKLFK